MACRYLHLHRRKHPLLTFFIVIAVSLAVTHLLRTELRAQGPSPSTYQIDRANSYFLAIAEKSGMFGFAAHHHAIVATQWTGDLHLDGNDLARSSASVAIPVNSLAVDTPEADRKAGFRGDPDADEQRKVQARMLSPEVFDAARYPEIRLKVASVDPAGNGELRLRGSLEMHGQTRDVAVPVRYARGKENGFTFDGAFTVKQTDFGMTPVSIAGGTVKVKDEVKIQFHLIVVPK